MSLYDEMRELRAPNCIALTVSDFYGTDLLSDGPLSMHGPVHDAMLADHRRDIDFLFDMSVIADALQSVTFQIE